MLAKFKCGNLVAIHQLAKFAVAVFQVFYCILLNKQTGFFDRMCQ